MIALPYIAEWRQSFPWALDSQVEQDLIISRSLIAIFADAELAESFAFRGGTALHKLYLNPAARYSEDIDLVQIHQEPIGPTLEKLRSVLDSWLGTPKREFNDGSVKLVYRLMSEGQPPIPMRLKIEINTREHFSLEGWQKYPFSISSGWYCGNADITTFTLEELLATKLRALYQRKKGRDIFDLSISLTTLKVDFKKVVGHFQEYMRRAGYEITLSSFQNNINAKMIDRRFTQDISPLLRPGIKWDLKQAVDFIQGFLSLNWS